MTTLHGCCWDTSTWNCATALWPLRPTAKELVGAYCIDNGDSLVCYNGNQADYFYCTTNAEINKNDFRGYYGLGNAYEILKMPYFALHYFRQAHKLKQVSHTTTHTKHQHCSLSVHISDPQILESSSLWATATISLDSMKKQRRLVSPQLMRCVSYNSAE